MVTYNDIVFLTGGFKKIGDTVHGHQIVELGEIVEDTFVPTGAELEAGTDYIPGALFFVLSNRTGENAFEFTITYHEMSFTGTYEEVIHGGTTIVDPVMEYDEDAKELDVSIPGFTADEVLLYEEGYPTNLVAIDSIEVTQYNEGDRVRVFAAVTNGARLFLATDDQYMHTAIDRIQRAGIWTPFPCYWCRGMDDDCPSCNGAGFNKNDWNVPVSMLEEYAEARGIPLPATTDELKGIVLADVMYLSPNTQSIRNFMRVVYDVHDIDISNYTDDKTAGAILGLPTAPGRNSFFTNYDNLSYILSRKEPGGGWMDWEVRTEELEEDFPDDLEETISLVDSKDLFPMPYTPYVDWCDRPREMVVGSSPEHGSVLSSWRMLATYDFMTDAGVADGTAPAEFDDVDGFALEASGYDGYQTYKGDGSFIVDLYPDDYKKIKVHFKLDTGETLKVAGMRGTSTFYYITISQTGAADAETSGSWDANEEYRLFLRYAGEFVYVTVSDRVHTPLFTKAIRRASWPLIDTLYVEGAAEIAGIDVYSGKRYGYIENDDMKNSWLPGDDSDINLTKYDTSDVTWEKTLEKPSIWNTSSYKCNFINGDKVYFPGYLEPKMRAGFISQSTGYLRPSFDFVLHDDARIEFQNTGSAYWASEHHGSAYFATYGTTMEVDAAVDEFVDFSVVSIEETAVAAGGEVAPGDDFESYTLGDFPAQSPANWDITESTEGRHDLDIIDWDGSKSFRALKNDGTSSGGSSHIVFTATGNPAATAGMYITYRLKLTRGVSNSSHFGCHLPMWREGDTNFVWQFTYNASGTPVWYGYDGGNVIINWNPALTLAYDTEYLVKIEIDQVDDAANGNRTWWHPEISTDGGENWHVGQSVRSVAASTGEWNVDNLLFDIRENAIEGYAWQIDDLECSWNTESTPASEATKTYSSGRVSAVAPTKRAKPYLEFKEDGLIYFDGIYMVKHDG